MNTEVGSLPESLKRNTTLRAVVLFYSLLSIHNWCDENASAAPNWEVSVEEDTRAVDTFPLPWVHADNIDRVKAALVPLSVCQPAIRFLLLPPEARPLPRNFGFCSAGDTFVDRPVHPGWDGWWHSRIELDQFVESRWEAGSNAARHDLFGYHSPLGPYQFSSN